MTEPIRSGIPSERTAEELTAWQRQVEANARRLEARNRGRRERFPAVVTAIDRSYTPFRYSWYEQTYDGAGNRVTLDGGRVGTSIAMPAYAFGDGSALSASDMPMPVMLTSRVLARDGSGANLGMVYEFPLYCGCLGGTGSGSGSGGGFVLVGCCPNPLPRTLHVVLHSANTTINGLSIPVTWDALFESWVNQSAVTSGGFTVLPAFTMFVFCQQGLFYLQISEFVTLCPFSQVPAGLPGSYILQFGNRISCHPLQIEFPDPATGITDYFGVASGPAACPTKEIVTFTVTE